MNKTKIQNTSFGRSQQTGIAYYRKKSDSRSHQADEREEEDNLGLPQTSYSNEQTWTRNYNSG